MDVILDGSRKKAIQIGTVMTHPDYRGRGLSVSLMNHVLELYEDECELFFLFANKSVLDFYPKFNFQQIAESQFSLDINFIPEGNESLRKLDVSNKEDLACIQKLLLSRKAVSGQFGVENNQGIFMFYMLNGLGDNLFISDQEKALVVYKQVGETIHLYDVVSRGSVNLEALLSQITGGHRPAKYVHFYFTPDLFTDHALIEPIDNDEDRLFVRMRTPSAMPASFRVPMLAHA
jgi:hypothetical protein